jgi:predicted GNAT superfamily acetyltransferase
MQIEYRSINQIDELEQVVDLEMAIWGLLSRDAVPSNLLHAQVYNQGTLIGAFHQQNLVGLAFGFPSRYPGGLWSHMTGVHPAYQGQGIGFALKQYQRQWALKHGYRTIHWTFDPLQRRNARFNISKLGAIAAIYHINYYGRMTDSINAGLPSDRLEVTWYLQERPHRSPQTDSAHDQGLFLLRVDRHTISVKSLSDRVPVYYVEIPFNIDVLKRNEIGWAQKWQQAVRDTLKNAFAHHYMITGFEEKDGCCWYILTQPEAWYMYVLRCADDSLYTGITTDLQRRVKQHNTGKGAAYTAARRPAQLIAAWQYPSRSEALQAEAAFKKQSRPAKLRIIDAGAVYRDGCPVRLP